MMGAMTTDPAAPRPTVADLGAALAVPAPGDGVVWALESSSDLNANLVRLGPGGSIGEHVNGEVDVLIVVVSGDGTLRVGDVEAPLGPDVLANVPKGTRRAVSAGHAGLAYLTVHRRRGPIDLGPARSSGAVGDRASTEIKPDEGGDPACWAHEVDDGG